MSGPDWYPWFPAKWASGVIGLSPEQRGVYMDVINIILDRGSCPEDYGYLAKACNCRRDRVQRVILQLVSAGKLAIIDAEIVQERAKNERRMAEERAIIGRRLAHSRWSETNGANGLGYAASHMESHTHTQTHTHTEKKERTSPSDSPAPNGAEHTQERVSYRFPDFWACWDIQGTKKDRAAAERKYRTIIKSKVATHDELCAGVRRYMAWCRRERQEIRYIKAPDVWLNKGCWTDEHPDRSGGGRQEAQTDFGKYGI